MSPVWTLPSSRSSCPGPAASAPGCARAPRARANPCLFQKSFPGRPSCPQHARLPLETHLGRTSGLYRARKLQKPVSGARYKDSTPELRLERKLHARNQITGTNKALFVPQQCYYRPLGTKPRFLFPRGVAFGKMLSARSKHTLSETRSWHYADIDYILIVVLVVRVNPCRKFTMTRKRVRFRVYEERFQSSAFVPAWVWIYLLHSAKVVSG